MGTCARFGEICTGPFGMLFFYGMFDLGCERCGCLDKCHPEAAQRSTLGPVIDPAVTFGPDGQTVKSVPSHGGSDDGEYPEHLDDYARSLVDGNRFSPHPSNLRTKPRLLIENIRRSRKAPAAQRTAVLLWIYPGRYE